MKFQILALALAATATRTNADADAPRDLAAVPLGEDTFYEAEAGYWKAKENATCTVEPSPQCKYKSWVSTAVLNLLHPFKLFAVQLNLSLCLCVSFSIISRDRLCVPSTVPLGVLQMVTHVAPRASDVSTRVMELSSSGRRKSAKSPITSAETVFAVRSPHIHVVPPNLQHWVHF